MDAISMALSTGLGPVVSVVLIIAFSGLVYKMAGMIPAFITAVMATIVLMFLDFLPVYWGTAILFAGIAGLVLGERNGD